MRFTYFRFKNFKGIEDQVLDLSKTPNSNIFTLVGLNESGKTTILEAINFFKYKQENLGALEFKGYTIDDIHSLIPINKRDNFNGFISIEAGIQITEGDVSNLREEFKKKDIKISSIGMTFTYTQKYYFENSRHNESKDKNLWDYNILGKKGKERTEKKLSNADALTASNYITKNLPSILYFPNFLFEFPERIYLDSENDEKHMFYQKIIQDALDSLQNNLNINDHIIKRIGSDDSNDKRNLTSLFGKLEKKLTEVIFKKWNQIFNKEINKSEIVLDYGTDTLGVYIEFNIKDDVDTYRIPERSLGFRWFFVYILLTQFRSFRKENKNAFFLFDEPASNLHPSAQSELLKSFEKLPKVIYTTHSQYLINPKWLESTFVIKNEAIDYENEETYTSKNTNVIINRYREFAIKHPNQVSYFQPILEVLDYKPSELELVPKLVFTEGKNDFYTLNYFIKTLSYGNKIHITPGTSASNMESLISLYLGWGSKFIILLDSDKEGEKQMQRYIGLFGDILNDSIFTLRDVDSLWKGITLESLIHDDDKKIIVNTVNSQNKVDKNTLNRSLQELYINDISVNLSTETKENFSKILTFLDSKLKTK